MEVFPDHHKAVTEQASVVNADQQSVVNEQASVAETRKTNKDVSLDVTFAEVLVEYCNAAHTQVRWSVLLVSRWGGGVNRRPAFTDLKDKRSC